MTRAAAASHARAELDPRVITHAGERGAEDRHAGPSDPNGAAARRIGTVTGVGDTPAPSGFAVVPPTEVLRLSDHGFDGLADDWYALARELPGTSFFQTPAWIRSWWETLGGRSPTLIGVWRGPSRSLDAVAALSRVRQSLHPRLAGLVPCWITAGSGAGAADHTGWLARPHLAAAVQAWIAEASADAALLLHNCDPALAVDIPGARPVWYTRCPRLAVSTDEAAMGWSSNFRQQLRRRERRLRADGVSFEIIDPPGMREDVLDALFALHHARWAKGDRPSSLTWDHVALHRRLLTFRPEEGGPAAVRAIHQGRCIGVVYGFWCGDVFAYYQMGWDPAYAEYGLGTVLLRQAIAMTAARGRTFDFLRGTEPFKYRFGAEDRTDVTWLVPRGPSGRLLALAFAGRRWLRRVRGRAALDPREPQRDA